MVNEDLIHDPMCMNLMQGGHGGFISTEQQRHRSIAGGSAFAQKLKNDSDFLKEHNNRSVANYKNDGKIRYDTFTGRKHTEETKEKMRESHKMREISGEKNGSYGTCWIYKLLINEYKNKKIKKDELDTWLSKGWIKGRKINGG